LQLKRAVQNGDFLNQFYICNI